MTNFASSSVKPLTVLTEDDGVPGSYNGDLLLLLLLIFYTSIQYIDFVSFLHFTGFVNYLFYSFLWLLSFLCV